MKKYLYLNSRDEFYRIDITKIVYFEADGNYTNVVLNNKVKGTVCMNLARMQQILSTNLQKSASIFVRIGKKYIINVTYVYHIAILRQTLELSDGENFNYSLNISKDALKGLREMFVNGLGTTVEDMNEFE
jgi:DNA-binding LytR/AlgR family response regulator